MQLNAALQASEARMQFACRTVLEQLDMYPDQWRERIDIRLTTEAERTR